MYFQLKEEDKRRINEELPDTRPLFSKAILLCPDLISMAVVTSGGTQDSTFPVAAVCLHDVAFTLNEVRLALKESLSCRLYYLERISPQNVNSAVFFSKYYIDDAALRIYAMGEHLAKAILYMFELDMANIPKQTDKTSLQCRVGNYLKDQMPDHPMTKAITALVNDPNWDKTIDYRNTWIHDQPPIIEGTGERYKRDVRWKIIQNENKSDKELHFEILLGAGDNPEMTVDEIINFVKGALIAFARVFETAVDIYETLIRQKNTSPHLIINREINVEYL